jgi:hypothetical protein
MVGEYYTVVTMDELSSGELAIVRMRARATLDACVTIASRRRERTRGLFWGTNRVCVHATAELDPENETVG